MSRFNLKAFNFFQSVCMSVCVCVCVCVFEAHILKQFHFTIQSPNFVIQNQFNDWYLSYDFVKFLDISVSN